MVKLWQNTIVPVPASIRRCIETIDSSSLQIALIVDDQGLLLGTVTDGDIRRAILGGTGLDSPVEQIMNREPFKTTPEQGRGEALRLMREHSILRVPVVDRGGHVVGLESLDSPLGQAVNDTWVVLMAGGLGSRLAPLTEDTPKPLLKVGGKPLLETIVDAFVGQGFFKFFLSVNYKAEQFKAHFGDGRDRGVEIRYLHEDERLGTAGALSLLPAAPDKSIIVMNGDLLTSVDFRHLLDFHRAQGSQATMCVRDYGFQVPYGVALLDGQTLTGISEKPRHHFFVNAGIYVLSPAALASIPAKTQFDMPQLFEKMIADGAPTAAFPIREYWLDIGHAEDLERARGDFPDVFGAAPDDQAGE